MGARIVVTGAQGFVGKHLVRRLADQGHNVICYDRKLGHELAMMTRGDFAVADRVFHLAAATDAQSEDMTQNVLDNVVVTEHLIRIYGGAKITFASTSMVRYPVNAYAITKRCAEDLVVLKGGGVVRFCNLYGEGGHSVIDKFSASDTLTIYGEGKQRRTYAHVSHAVTALLACGAGDKEVLTGRTMTVKQVADHMYPDKPRTFVQMKPTDLIEGAQKKWT